MVVNPKMSEVLTCLLFSPYVRVKPFLLQNQTVCMTSINFCLGFKNIFPFLVGKNNGFIDGFGLWTSPSLPVRAR